MIAIVHKTSEFSGKCRERGERSAETGEANAITTPPTTEATT